MFDVNKYLCVCLGMGGKSPSTWTWQPLLPENGTSVLVIIGREKKSEIVPDFCKLISVSEKRARQANFGNASFPSI